MSKAKMVEVFTPRNRLAEKAVERDEPVEELIDRAESAVAALGAEIGPQLDPEIRELGGRLAAFAKEGRTDSSTLDEIKNDVRQLSEVAGTLGYSDIGQVLNSLQGLLTGAELTAKTDELARLHIAALEQLSGRASATAAGNHAAHPVARELERATQHLSRKRT